MRELTLSDFSKALADYTDKDEKRAEEFLSGMVKAVQESVASDRGIELAPLGRLVIQLADGGGETAVTAQADFTRDLGGRLNIPPESADNILKAFLANLQKELLTSKCAKIDGFGVFEIKRDKAKIQRDEKHGHKLVAPAKKSFHFAPDATLKPGLNTSMLVFEIAADFRAKVEVTKASGILLAVPEHDFFVKTLESYFRKAGWHTAAATSVVDALNKLDSEGTFLVILDSTLKGYQKLCETLKTNKETSFVPLIILFNKGVNTDQPTEFMICGDEHIVQPFEIRKLLNICDSELVRSAEEEAIFEHQVLFQFPTEDAHLDKANEFGHRLFEKSGMAEEDQVALCAAFREAIGNAAQHGNKYRRDKKIEILYLLDKEKITAMVKDMGQGFDHNRYVNRGKAGDALTAARERH
ncbi:MAG: HU family DNA-binding protein [Planctomycetes bacterium]|nr:HU family DNA-binding protein [Planctomycetota bacterium]